MDQLGFEALAVQYRRRIFLCAFRILRDRQAAEDAVQEALFRLYRGLVRGSVREPGPWLMTTVTHLAFDELSRRLLEARSIAAAHVPPEPDPRGRMEARSALSQCERVMAEQRPELQASYRHLCEGLNSSEVSTLDSTPSSTHRSRSRQIREILRDCR